MGIIMENILNFIQVVVLLPLILGFAGMMGKGKSGMLPVFFTFSMLSYFLSSVYYLVYGFLRPGERMPFAVNEIAECAMLLLICAGLETFLTRDMIGRLTAMLFAVFFVGINIILWILWSGEWVQDIVFGLPYIYMLYLLIRGNIHYKTIGMVEGHIAMYASLMVLLLQMFTIKATGTLRLVVDRGSYLVAYGLALWLFWSCKKALQESGVKAIFLTVTLFWWTIMVMYMSSGIYYDIAEAMNILAMPLLYFAMKKEVGERDLC